MKTDLEVLKYLTLEISARKIAKILDLSYNAVSQRYQKIRERIVEFLDHEFKKLRGEIEIDEDHCAKC